MPTLFYRAAHGGVGRIDYSDNTNPRLPEGAVEIYEDEYLEGLEAWQQERDGHVETLRAGERAQAADDLAALLAVGVPEPTARRLTGTVRLDIAPDVAAGGETS